LCPRVLYLKKGALIFDGVSTDGIPLFFREQVSTAEICATCGIKKSNKPTALSDEKLNEIKANAAWVGEPFSEGAPEGKLLAVAFFDENGEPKTAFKIGERIKISIAYKKHGAYSSQIAVGLTNKHGHLVTATGSAQLGIYEPNQENFDGINYFDLWLTLMLEAGNYSITITLGYETGINLGDRLDQTPPIGPIQVVWDYGKDRAPFIGQCGLPARAAFLQEAM